MALLGSTFVTDEVEDLSYNPIPADVYIVQVTKSEMKATKDATGEMLKLEFTVLEGEYSGRKIYENLNLVNKNEMAVKIARSKLKQICQACGLAQIEDSAELHGIPFKGLVVIEESKDPKYDPQNRLKKAMSLEGAAESASSEDSPW
jgi:hypothetical protein